jgi:hypothetical protein
MFTSVQFAQIKATGSEGRLVEWRNVSAFSLMLLAGQRTKLPNPMP